MSYSATVIADSISPLEVRLTTLQISLPKFCLAQLNTHRMLSRNASSSRAIPVKKLIQEAIDNPVIPTFIGANKAGMQATEEMCGEAREKILRLIEKHRKLSIEIVTEMSELLAHKQLVNRYLEAHVFANVVISSTTWTNFFKLRLHHAAQPEIQQIAQLMKEAMDTSKPTYKEVGQWHLPYISEDEKHMDIDHQKMCSIARCARVSYAPYDSDKPNINKDLELAKKLIEECHYSPLEHPATPINNLGMYGNFRGWKQARFDIRGESGE